MKPDLSGGTLMPQQEVDLAKLFTHHTQSGNLVVNTLIGALVKMLGGK